MNQDRICSKAA